MGWRRTSARAIVHGPVEHGGFNIPHLYAIHGASKLMTVYTNIQAKSELGQVFIININWLQLLIGRQKQFFQDNRPVVYLRQNWLLHLQEYMGLCNLSFASRKFWVPKHKRQNDVILMEAAHSYTEKFSVLRCINNWRLFFQAITLSDICDGQGKQILEPYREYREVGNHKKYRKSKLNWPRQDQPNKDSFKIWTRFLQRMLGMQNKGIIRNKLGTWLETPSNSENKWTSYYESESSFLCKQSNNLLYDIFPKVLTGRLGSLFSSIRETQWGCVPPTAVPATIEKQTSVQIQASFQNSIQLPVRREDQYIPRGPEARFERFLRSRDNWIRECCSNWESETTEVLDQIFAEEDILTLNVAIAHTFKFGIGGYGLAIANKDKIIFTNKGKIIEESDDDLTTEDCSYWGFLARS